MFSKIRIAIPLALALSLGASTVAFAAPPADAPAHAAHEGRHHGHGARGPSLFVRASQLSSLSQAQRSQIQDMIRDEQAQKDAVKASRGKVMSAVADQVERGGAINKAALAPLLKSDADVRIAAALKNQALRQQLHTLLTAAQVQEVSGGKDFAKTTRSETEIRAHVTKHDDKRLERLEKSVGSMSPEARTKLAERLRAHAR